MSAALVCPAGHPLESPGPCPLCFAATLPNPGDTAAAPRPAVPPPVVPGYEVGGEIGSGGMGVVYRARQLNLGRDVALKVLRGGDLIPPAERRRFTREAQVVAGLRHPNIVQVYDVGEVGGQPFYTMELIDGVPLSTSLGADAKPDHRQAAVLVAAVARAVEHAHRHGVIHRDLKPANVLLDVFGTPKLVDFGVAKRLAADTGLTEPGKLVGTPHYMAPEQAAGKPDVGPAADVYSLGVILYRMLAGRVPFDGDTLYSVLHKIVTEEAVSPAYFRAEVPRDLEAVCLKCLQKDPAKRYPTASALADDLERFLAHKPVQAGRTPAWARAVKWVRRHPAIAAAVVVALLAGVGVGVVVAKGFETERKHEDDLKGERRQRAMADAVTAAMSGEVSATEAALKQAEADGATEGDLALLRGVTDYQQGRFRAAVGHLDASVRFDPESVAARSLRTLCYAELLDWARVEEGVADVRGRQPETTHDYLFKGYLFALRWEPEVGLPLLEEAARRKLMLAHACLARTRAVNAFELGDRTDRKGMEQALKSLGVANEVLSPSPFLGLVNLEVRMYAAFAYEEADEKDERAKAAEQWAEARKAADTAGWGSRATNHRRILAEHDGGPPAGLKSALRDWETCPDRGFAPHTALASAEYEAGRVSDALDLLQKYRSDDPNSERVRGFLLAEQKGPAAAEAVYDELEKRYADSSVALLYIQDILLVAGDWKRVAENARRFRRDEPFKGLRWTGEQTRTLEFLAGERTAAEFVAKASGRRNKCTAHYLIGALALATGDRAKARDAFRKAVETHSFLRFAYSWSGNFLTRMDADPAWPRWVR